MFQDGLDRLVWSPGDRHGVLRLAEQTALVPRIVPNAWVSRAECLFERGLGAEVGGASYLTLDGVTVCPRCTGGAEHQLCPMRDLEQAFAPSGSVALVLAPSFACFGRFWSPSCVVSGSCVSPVSRFTERLTGELNQIVSVSLVLL